MPQATQNPLRAVFAGIGRILSVTDKVRNKPTSAEAPAASPAAETAAPETAVPESTAPEAAETETEAAATATAPEAETAAPETATAEPAKAEAKVEAPEAEKAVSEAEAPQAEAPAETPAEPKAAAATASEDLPLPNYGDLTIASVRARLRNLSIDQLNTLVEYEKANAARQDFISMFERRIAKVESEKK